LPSILKIVTLFANLLAFSSIILFGGSCIGVISGTMKLTLYGKKATKFLGYIF